MSHDSSNCEMTAVFSATWQSLRLGLDASPSGRAAFSALRTTLSTSRQSTKPLQHFLNCRRLSYCTHNLSGSAHNQRSKLILRSTDFLPLKQSRWASLWKPVPKPEEEEGTEFEVHEDEIKNIFGHRMNLEKGAEVLIALQTRRIEGTLDQKLEYPDAWIQRGLAYLRGRFPMDEDAAIIARIDREIENGILSSQPNTAVSQFEVLRRRNKQEEIERRRREAEEEKKLESKGTNGPKGMQSRKTSVPDIAGRQRPPMPEWVRNYQEKTEQMALPPDITTVQRLLPSGLLVVVVVTLSLLFAKYYKPPSRDARLFPEVPPAAATVLTIMAANVLVAFMWRLPPLWPLMYTTFAVTPMYPHARTMLSASFSHQQFLHLFINMFILWMLGTKCMNPRFSLLYNLHLTSTNSARRYRPRTLPSPLLRLCRSGRLHPHVRLRLDKQLGHRNYWCQCLCFCRSRRILCATRRVSHCPTNQEKQRNSRFTQGEQFVSKAYPSSLPKA